MSEHHRDPQHPEDHQSQAEIQDASARADGESDHASQDGRYGEQPGQSQTPGAHGQSAGDDGQGHIQQPQHGGYLPGYGYPYPPVDPRAQSQATTALVLGIVGLVSMLGVILGPIALVQARKAREGGADATAGRVLGWIATIIGALSVLLIIGWVIFVLSILGTALHNTPTGTPSAAGLTAPLRMLFG